MHFRLHEVFCILDAQILMDHQNHFGSYDQNKRNQQGNDGNVESLNQILEATVCRRD